MEKLFFEGQRGIVTKLENLARHKPMELDILLFDQNKRVSKNITGILVSLNYAFNLRKKQLEFDWKGMTGARNRIEQLGWDVIWFGNKSMRTLKANQSLEAMLRDQVWSDELADIFEFQHRDLVFYYSFKIYITSFVNSQTEQKFKDYIWAQAREFYQIEYQKYEAYINEKKGGANPPKSLLRKLVGSLRFERENPVPPRLYIEEVLFGKDQFGDTEFQRVNTQVAIYNSELARLTERRNDGDRAWYNGEDEITQHRFRSIKKSLEGKLRELHQRNEFYARHLFDDKESNKAVTFINAVGRRRLNQELLHQRGEADAPKFEDVEGSYLRVTSIAQGQALIKEWVRWYNETYKLHIAEDKSIEDARKEKERRDERLSENRLLKKQQNVRIVELYMEGMNNAQISEQSAIPVRTVGDVVKKYQKVVELWDKGISLEEIQEQTGYHLNTVYSFLESRIGEEALLEHLEQSTLSELQAHELEEQKTRERMLLRKAEVLHKEQTLKEKAKQFNKLLEYHNKGFTPSHIARTLHLQAISRKTAARQVARILLDGGIIPHFDYEIATKEEVEAHHQKQEEERKSNKRPLTDI